MMFKVAMVSFAEFGGHPTYVREVISAVHRQSPGAGLAIELVTSVALDERFRRADYAIHPVLPAYPVRKAMGWAAYKLRQFLHPLRVDRTCIEWLGKHPEFRGIHFQDYYNLGTAFHIKDYRRTGKWLAFTVHNIRPHKYYPFLGALMDALARHTWRNCDALFVHTDRLKHDLAAFLGEGHPPIHVTPHGTFNPRPLEGPRTLEARMALKRLLFFGAVRKNKGLHTILEAMEDLEGFSLTIAGGTFAERAYWDEAIAPRIESLRARGRTIDLIDTYIAEESLHALWDAHSAVLLPYTEGFQAQSGVLFLALGLETPIVASRAGGLGQTLLEHPIGEVMDSNDAAGFRKALLRLYEQPVQALAANLKSARSELSWERHAEMAIGAYLRLDNPPAP